MPGWYAGLVGLMAMQRLAELADSRRRERRWGGGRQAAARSYPVMVAVHAGLLTLPLLEVGVMRRRARRPLVWVGVLGAAALLRRWSIQTLGASWSAKGVVPAGLRPVASGPYRFIRHPNYLAVLLEFAALPLAGGAWLSALVLSALDGLVLWDRIRDEERLLAEVPGYEEAMNGKARFLPGLL